MSEPADPMAPGNAPRTAGALLREARQAQGLHIAALSAAIKVAQRKLESLEADRLDELPDATFTRALAQTVCRSLKIDPVPVLALLPSPAAHRLEHVGEGINEPFRDRPGRREPSDWSMLGSPVVWGPVLLVIAAAALYLLPEGWLAGWQGAAPRAPAHAASATVSSVVPTHAASETTAVAPSEVTVNPPLVVESAASAASPATAASAAPSN